MINADLFTLIKRLKSIADIGVLYAENEYDKERYSEILGLGYELLHQLTGQEIPSLKNVYAENKDYPTAKVDVRGLIIMDNKILLVKESAYNKWSLPGGWADIGYSPKEVIAKECKEETGLEVIPERLLAVFDKKFHPHPPQPFYVYKMVFYCKSVSTVINKGFDVLDVEYFDISNLPELSEERILKSQLELVFQKAFMKGEDTYFE
ncbi:MAG: NUDIX hydrolase N-terminal domain-containing protein [Ferruginibacter sp.]